MALVVQIGQARLRMNAITCSALSEPGDKCFHADPAVLACCRGTSGWMAPEVLRAGQRITAKADIFSLGMVMLEMATERLPFDFHGQPGRAAHMKDLRSGRWSLPAFAPGRDTVLGSLIAQCTQDSASERPDAAEVYSICEQQLRTAAISYQSQMRRRLQN